MTQYELFSATMAHKPTGRFLYYAGFIAETERNFRKYAGLAETDSIAEKFGMYAPAGINMRPPANYQKPDFSRYFADMERPPRSYINSLGVLEIPGSVFHFTQYVSPLRNCTTVAEIEDFPYPTAEGFTDDHMKAEVDAVHARGMVAESWIGHQYESAWQIRGYEEFLMDMHANPDVPHYIMDKVNKNAVARATAAARAGVDILRCGDDVANQRALMFKPEMWREFMKPRWKAVFAAAKAIKPDIQIWYHSDGDISAIIPELIEIGVTVLNPVQPECMDVAVLKKNYGSALVFDGIIGTQTTMPFGTPAQVKQVVRETKRDYGQDGALILSPTHVLEPDVPSANIAAFLEACAEA